MVILHQFNRFIHFVESLVDLDSLQEVQEFLDHSGLSAKISIHLY